MNNNEQNNNQITDVLQDQSNIIIEKKKRGRKPKNAILDNNINTDNLNNDVLKKRGRKANSKIISITDDPIITENNIIVHLPLNNIDITKIMTKSPDINTVDKIINDTIDNNHTIINLTDDFNIEQHKQCDKCLEYENKINQLVTENKNLRDGVMTIASTLNKKIYNSKANFIDNKNNEWVEHTDIACWWCCHKFNTVPLGIPEHIDKNKYYLFGCFCSFNCMLAYNLDMNDYKIWDRQSHIYQMKNYIDPDNIIQIKPAPPRQTLQMFGGHMSIEEFRNSFYILNREYRCLLPPMISIICITEEDNRDIILHNNIKQLAQKITRKKPLPNQACGLNILINQ